MPAVNREGYNKRSSSKPGWKILLLFLSIPAFLLLAEAVLTIIPIDTYFRNRFFLVNRALDYPDVCKKDHHLFWRLRPSQVIRSRYFAGKEYRINSYGLRGEEIPPKSDKIRIIAIGNSCTFGWGVQYNDTYIKQLEAMINHDDRLPQVEIINAGIPGYTSLQGKRFFSSDITRLKPDVVLIMFSWNDQWAAAGNIPDKEQKPPPEYIIDIQNLFARLKTYRLIKKLILSTIEEPLEARLIKENPVYRVNTDDFYDNLDAIVQSCKRERVIPILLTSPIPSLEKYYPPWMRSPRHKYHFSPMHQYHALYNNRTRLLAQDSETALVDIALQFDKHDNLYNDAVKDPIHFNVEGHKVAAKAIYDLLKSNPNLFL